MRALILNSGIGKRMGKFTKTKNKCMVEIGDGLSVLAWQIRLLKGAGITDVVITTGPFAKDLEHYITQKYPEINFVFCFNPLYDSTNYIYSIYLARNVLEDDIVLMHGDLVYEESVLADILSQKQSTMVIDRTLPLPEKDFKAVIESGKIVKVGIEFFDYAFAAQPLYKLLKEDWLKWMRSIEQYCENNNRNVYAENAMNDISDTINLLPFDVNGRICTEIDNLDDLARVREIMKSVLKNV